MNLFSETDNNALDEHLRNVICTVDDTDIATTYTQYTEVQMKNQQTSGELFKMSRVPF
jgi:hypothetical protein